MPKVSKVPADLAVHALKKHISHFTTDKLPHYSSKVWNDIANELNGLWNAQTVQVNVKGDRRKILTRAREECRIYLHGQDNVSVNLNNSSDNWDKSDTTYYLNYNKLGKFESSVCNIDDDDYKNFDVILTRDEWNRIKCDKPLVYKRRKYYGFKPGVWTNIVSQNFWEQHRLKCAFVFKRGRIYEYGINYAVMIGHCKDKTCRNPIYGIIKDPPGKEGPVIITMKCRDTRFSEHVDVKRPLNGEKRKEIQKKLLCSGVSAWRMEEAKNSLKPGETGSPFLYDPNTLTQAKKQAVDRKLGIQPDEYRDILLAIQKLNENPESANSILEMDDSPFYLIYVFPT